MDSPAEEIDGCGQPSCAQEGTQRKSFHLEPLNKIPLDKLWNWYLQKDSLLPPLLTSFKFAPCVAD